MRWLDIAVRTNGGGAFTPLSPRQPLTPIPYALYAPSAGTAVTATMASSVTPGAVTSADLADASVTPAKLAPDAAVQTINGLSGTVHLAAGTNITITPGPENELIIGATNTGWILFGNAGTSPDLHYLGTADNQPLELRVNGQRALRLEPNTNAAPNILGGSPFNSIAPGAFGATIAGGGGIDTQGWRYTNRADANFATIGGGRNNTVADGARDSVIAGGYVNRILTDAQQSAIGGGWNNVIQESGNSSTIGGGTGNVIGPNSRAATVPGGEGNAALGDYSFSAGYRAKASHDGAFVWADSTDADFVSTGANQFLIRAAGGVGIGTAAPAEKLEVAGAVVLGNTANASPKAGPLRWTGSDFEGYNGTRWVSLTRTEPVVVPVTNMVWIRPGSFVLGSPADEKDRDTDEGPQTSVTISRGFWMDIHEVTQGEYQAVMGSNPSSFTGDLNRPVEMVSWEDATNYCGKLTQQERNAGRIPALYAYRLPTEAEWEYACRAGTQTRFSYGDDLSYTNLGKYAWYFDNSGSQTHAVGQRLPNAWGLCDMHGNVWEWCQDGNDPYPGGSVTDPRGSTTGSWHVYRGGGWGRDAIGCRSANRNYDLLSGRRFGLGFRSVLIPGQP